jgi:hypothetical protein
MSWRHMEESRYSSTILDLGIRWRWIVSFTPLPLYPRGNGLRFPLDGRLGEPQSRSGCCGEEKNVALLGIEPRPSSPQPVAIPTLVQRGTGSKNNIRYQWAGHNTYVSFMVAVSRNLMIRIVPIKRTKAFDPNLFVTFRTSGARMKI